MVASFGYFFMVTSASAAIPNRWLSVARHVGPMLVNDEPGGRSVGISLRLGLKGYAAEGTARHLVLAEMGQIDRRRRRRGCAQTSAVYFLHRGLDKPFSIDGGILFLGIHSPKTPDHTLLYRSECPDRSPHGRLSR